MLGCSREQSPAHPRIERLDHPDSYPMGLTFSPVSRLALLRDGGGIAAMSMVCTHQACLLTVRQGGGFRCPCHGAIFDGAGKVLEGPAKKDLIWYELKLTEDGHLAVDRSSVVDAGWRLEA